MKILSRIFKNSIIFSKDLMKNSLGNIKLHSKMRFSSSNNLELEDIGELDIGTKNIKLAKPQEKQKMNILSSKKRSLLN